MGKSFAKDIHGSLLPNVLPPAQKADSQVRILLKSLPFGVPGMCPLPEC